MTKSLLHLVFGGEVRDPQGCDFVDSGRLDVVGIYPSYKAAYDAWRGASQAHVDEAHVKYVLVHIHRLIERPEEAEPDETGEADLEAPRRSRPRLLVQQS